MCNMKFGKLGKIDGVDFSLPQDHSISEDWKKKWKRSSTHLYVGCTGWAMKEWVGNYYPKGTKSSSFLEIYAQQFNTIELNSTYYQIPSTETVKKWKSQTETGFKFAPKIPQSISHDAQLNNQTKEIEHFCHQILHLDDRLGRCFLQLPPKFGPRQFDILEEFLNRFPRKEIQLAVEIRNEQWLSDINYGKHFFQLLHDFQVGTVISDVAGRRDVLHMVLTQPNAMIRFVGNDLVESDYLRCLLWIERIKEWMDLGINELYFFHHQDNNILAPKLSAWFTEKLNETCGSTLKIPIDFSKNQLSLF